jgi:hypothetical protein
MAQVPHISRRPSSDLTKLCHIDGASPFTLRQKYAPKIGPVSKQIPNHIDGKQNFVLSSSSSPFLTCAKVSCLDALPRGLPVVPWSVAPALIPRCASPRCVSPPGTTLISIYLNWSFGTIFPQLDLGHKPQMAQLVFNSSQIVPFFSSPRGAIFWVFWFLSWAIYFGIGVSFIADLSSLRKSNKGSGTPRLIKCF